MSYVRRARINDQSRVLSPFSTWQFFSREQAKSECDCLVMSSVLVASQSRCFFLCSREQIRLVENRLYISRFLWKSRLILFRINGPNKAHPN